MNIKKNVLYLVSLLSILLASYLMLNGGGITPNPRDTILLSMLFLILSSSKKAFYIVAFPVMLAYILYTPIGLTFGSPSYKYVASIFSTDFLESKEFLSQIPYKSWLTTILTIVLFFSFYYLTRKNSIKYYKNKTLICLLVIIALLDQAPFKFFNTLADSIIKVKDELALLNSFPIKNEWGKSTINEKSKYDYYVLIIGESARKDYHHIYGYPINNTPFLSSSKGTIVNGMTSGGSNTVESLRVMLTKVDKNNLEPNYGLNLINLANSAGMKTFWLSNQGYMGKYDSPVTAISKNSDVKIFLKSGDYESSNTSDFELVDKFNALINKDNNTKEKRLIVLHLYGSHPHACSRISDYKRIVEVNDMKYHYISCYISSIQKTDEFIKNIYDILDKNYIENNKSFSIIYFSDHGQSHKIIDNRIVLNNNYEGKNHFDIPLIKISSDDDAQKNITSFKSAVNFVDGIANWIGISNKKLSNEDLFDGINDENDYGLKNRIKNINKENDPAIDITGK